MKKFFMFMAAALMTFSLASCDKKDKNEPETPAAQDTTVVEGMTFDIQVSGITYKSATVTVTPSKNDVDYFWNLVEKEALDYYQVDATGYAEVLLEYYAEQGYKYADLVGGYLIVSGKDEYEYDVDAETAYVVFAFQITKDLKIEGKVASKEFTTPARQAGEPIDEYEALEDMTHNFAEYSVDASYLENYGTLDISAQDENNYIYLEFNAEDGAEDLVAGSYPINASGEANTFTASEGMMSYMGYTFVTGSYVASIAEGSLATPLWYLVSGTVTINADGSIVVNALNSANKSVQCTLTTRVAAEEEGEEGKGEAPARKAAKKITKKSLKAFKK